MPDKSANNTVLTTAVTNPFAPYTSRRVEVAAWVPGATVEYYIRNIFPQASDDLDVSVSLSGRMLTPGEIHTVVVQPNDGVVLLVHPHGGGGEKNPLQIIAMLVVMVVAIYAGPAVAAAYGPAMGLTEAAILTAGKIITGMIVMAGGLMVNALLGPSPLDVPELSAGSPTYSWDAKQNFESEGAPWPVVYGRCRVQPPLIGKYTEIIGNEQHINLLYAVADHSVDSIDDIEINESSINNYPGCWPDVRIGSLTQLVMDNFDDTIEDVGVDKELPKAVRMNKQSLAYCHPMEPYGCGPLNYRVDTGGTDVVTTIGVEVKLIRALLKVEEEYYKDGTNTEYWPAENAHYVIDLYYRKAGSSDAWTTVRVEGDRKIFYAGGGFAGPILQFAETAFIEIEAITLSPDQYEVKIVLEDSNAVPESLDVRGHQIYWVELKDADYDPTGVIAPVERTVEGTAYDAFYLHALFPTGLFGYGQSIYSATVSIAAGVQKAGGTWEEKVITVTSSSQQPIRRTFKFGGIEHGVEYKVRMRYATAPPSIESSGSGVTYQDTCIFSFYQKVINDNFSYPGASLLAIRALASDLLYGQIPRVSCVVERSKVWVHDGADWVEKPAANPAWAVYDMFVNGCENHEDDSAYGYAIDYSRMLYADFLAWANWCNDSDDDRWHTTDTSKFGTGVGGTNTLTDATKSWGIDALTGLTLVDSAGTTFTVLSNTATVITVDGNPANGAYTIEFQFRSNIYFDTSRRSAQAISLLETLGWGKVVEKGTSFGVIIDKPSTPTQVFGVGNIKANTFKIEYFRSDNLTNLVDVTYYDAATKCSRQCAQITRQDYVEGESEDEKTQLDLIGCTSRALAIYHAQYMMACNQVLRKTMSLEADVDAIACQVGDVIAVSHDVPQWGYSGRVVSATSNSVTIDRSITMSPGTTYQVMIRHQTDVDSDGADDFEIKTIAAVLVETTTTVLTLASGTWTNTPAADAVYLFGETGALYEDFRVINITRAGDQSRKIIGLNYDADIYQPDQPVSDDDPVSDLVLIKDLSALEIYCWASPTKRGYVHLSWRGQALCWWGWYRNDDEDPAPWKALGPISTPYFNVENLEPMHNYTFAISGTQSISDDTDVSQTVSLFYYGFQSPGAFPWIVRGIRIKDRPLGKSEFFTPDITIQWEYTDNWTPPAGEEAAGAGTGIPYVFDYFRVEVWTVNPDTGRISAIKRHEDLTRLNEFTYSIQMNEEDMGDDEDYPASDLEFHVYGYGADGGASITGATLRVHNDEPRAPANLTATSVHNGVLFEWYPPKSQSGFNTVALADWKSTSVRSKLADGPWSLWSETLNNSHRVSLAIPSGLVSVGYLYSRIYVQVKHMDVFGQFSSIAEADEKCNQIWEIYTHLNVTLGDTITGDASELVDGDRDSGGVTIP